MSILCIYSSIIKPTITIICLQKTLFTEMTLTDEIILHLNIENSQLGIPNKIFYTDFSKINIFTNKKHEKLYCCLVIFIGFRDI